MIVMKTYRADHPAISAVYTMMAFGVVTIYLAGSLDLVGLVACLLMLACLFFSNAYFFRIEFNEKQINGPGFYGPMHRVSIPWNEADVHFDKKQGKLHYILIRRKKSKQKIKIARANFSDKTLKHLKHHIQHHHPDHFVEED